MKRPPHDDGVSHLREQLRLRIDLAAKAVAEVLLTAADLFVTMSQRTTGPGIVTKEVEASRVPEMMTQQQAADYLGVKASTLGIWRCRRSYEIPFVKVGSKVRYRKADLDHFLQRRTQRGGDEDASR